MALTLISRSPRRVGVALTATGAGFYIPDEGYRALSGTKEYVKPPAGIWTVTIEGKTLSRVWFDSDQSVILAKDGKISFTRRFKGWDSMLVSADAAGTCVMVLEEAPPLRNCVLARLGVALWR